MKMLPTTTNLEKPNFASRYGSLTLDTVGVENEDVIADPLRLEQILINIMRREVHAGRWADQPVDCTEGYGSGRLCRF